MRNVIADQQDQEVQTGVLGRMKGRGSSSKYAEREEEVGYIRRKIVTGENERIGGDWREVQAKGIARISP